MGENIDAEFELEKQLIEEVKNHKILYDHASSGYRDFNLKQGVWKEIAYKLMRGEDETNSSNYYFKNSSFLRVMKGEKMKKHVEE